MPIAPRDPRWKTAAGEIKSKEVLDLNEDLNIIVSKMKGVDTNLAKVYSKLRDEHAKGGEGLPTFERHMREHAPPPLVKLAAAVRAVGAAHEEVEKASNLLNEAAQYFDF
jgi:hypothetical protein